MKYQYNEGAHEPQSAGDFLGVCGILDKLHKEMKVHSDVRLANMILTERTYLIDFDFAKATCMYSCINEEYFVLKTCTSNCSGILLKKHAPNAHEYVSAVNVNMNRIMCMTNFSAFGT